jgi:hypothetical protein
MSLLLREVEHREFAVVFDSGSITSSGGGFGGGEGADAYPATIYTDNRSPFPALLFDSTVSMRGHASSVVVMILARSTDAEI